MDFNISARKSTMFVFISAVIFSTGGLFFKICPWEALAISSGRAIIAGSSIFIFLRIMKHKFVFNRNVFIAALAMSFTNTLYAAANKLTTAGNAIVLQFSMPIFVILIMFLAFKKKPTRLEILTCILVLAGIIFFFVDSFSAGNTLGNALALLAGVAYACYFIFNAQGNSDPFTAVCISYALTAIIGLPSLMKTDIAGSGATAILAVVALGVIQQGAGQMCLAVGIRGTSPVAAGLISGIEPVLNPIIVAVFYHELLTPLSLVGASLVLISVMFYNYMRSKSSPKLEQ